MQEISEFKSISAFDNLLSCEEAILKNESSGNSYLINDPSKLNIFPNYLIGNLKSVYFINNEKYIGEGVGILVGEDVILTSAHNLIFSQLEDGNIINYKPHSISFHLLSNGYLEILEPINCQNDSIIYSDYFKDFKFVENQELSNTCNTVKNKDPNLRKNTDVYIKDEKTIDLVNSNYHKINVIEYKSKSSDYTSLNGGRLSKKLNINNISEIPLAEDYAIIFTEVNIGSDILNLFCDKETKLFKDLISVDDQSRLFMVFEKHVNFIKELENSDSNKFKNSKISMISSIKYNSNLLGVPQYVYGSHFNDLNNKIFKNKKQTKALKIEDNKNDCKFTLTEAKIGYNTPVSSYDFLRDDNDFEDSRCTIKNRKWEKEFKHCLFINYDKNSNKKHLRNPHLDNLRKLLTFNCEEFYSEGKLVQCEARGKLCSLLFEKLRKTPADNKGFFNLISPRYEGNREKTTPYFNRQNKEKDEKSLREDSMHVFENMEDLSSYDLNNDLQNRSITILKDLSCPEISEDIADTNRKQTEDLIYNKIFKEKLEEILKYSFSENIELDLNKSKETQNENLDRSHTNERTKQEIMNSLNDPINNLKLIRRNSIIDKSYKNIKSSYNQTKLNQMKEYYLKNKEYVNYTVNSKEDASLPEKSRNFSHNFHKDLKNEINCENQDFGSALDKNELNYMITTYKGQSGSPLFVRIKNEKLIEMQREDLINCVNDKYSFIFLGLHSRSPEYFEPINKQKYQNGMIHKNLNSEIKSDSPVGYKDENNQNKRQIINININLNEEIKDLNININLNSLIEKQHNQNLIGLKDPSGNSLHTSNDPLLKKELVIKEYLKKNNYCSYNVGLKISVDIFNKIKKSIIDKRLNKKELQESKTIHQEDPKYCIPDDRIKIFNSEANFMLLNFYIYEEYFVKGIFNLTSHMKTLFDIASDFLEVDKRFILLNINEESIDVDECGNEYIFRFFEMKGKLNNKKEHKGIFRATINANFVININKYSDFISDKLFSKLNDNIRNFENNKAYDNSEKSNLKIIIRYIFNELQTFFEKSQTLYGLLYNAIKTKMIKSS